MRLIAGTVVVAGGILLGPAGSAEASTFSVARAPFNIVGSRSGQIAITPPSGYATVLAIAEHRKYQAGDADYAVRIDYDGSVFKYATNYAPNVSHGIVNTVGGYVSLLALKGNAYCARDRVRNEKSASWPFSISGAKRIIGFWTMATDTDDDYRFASSIEPDAFKARTWGGRGGSHTVFNRCEIGNEQAVQVKSWKVSGVQPVTTVAIPHTVGLSQHSVFATVSSYLTADHNAFGWNIDCSDAGAVSVCTIGMTGTQPLPARVSVEGFMMVVEG